MKGPAGPSADLAVDETVFGGDQTERLRVAVLAWMVAGVRTQFENLQRAGWPADMQVETFQVTPYRENGWIESLPVLRSSYKGTLRSIAEVVPVVSQPTYDAVLTQTTLPLLPLFARSLVARQSAPATVLAIDTTPALMDEFSEAYYGVQPAGPAKRRNRDLLHRIVLSRCTFVAPWSEWAARSFVDDYGVPPERVKVIPPGVDLTQWTVPNRPEISRDEPFKLLFVGADFERKGGPLLVDVFRHYLADRCELHLVTKADVAESPGIRVYRGFGINEPGLLDLYARCHALVLPTRADCFSLASIEAMACGLPVISCPVGGIPEIVIPGHTGLLIPPDDGRALLSAIESLLQNRAHAQALGRHGRATVEQHFDTAVVTRQLFDLLREAVTAA